MITLEIPRATPSMNATHHKHWRVMFRQKQLWKQEVWAARRQLPFDEQQTPPPKRAKVTIERYSARSLDIDNYVGGLKSCIDALKAECLIVDDDAEHLELVAIQYRGSPRTVIRIEAA